MKTNLRSCSHLLLKILRSGEENCSGDCVTLSPPPYHQTFGILKIIAINLSWLKTYKLHQNYQIRPQDTEKRISPPPMMTPPEKNTLGP